MTLTYTRASPGRETLHETVTLSFPRILEELLQSGLEIEIPATLSVLGLLLVPVPSKRHELSPPGGRGTLKA